MTLISFVAWSFALHATTSPPPACQRPLIEALSEIARAAADKDFNAAVRAQQTVLLPRFREQLEDFEVDLLNAAPQGYLIVTDHQSIYAGSSVGHLRVREGVLAKRPQFLYEATAPLILAGRHGAELSPFGLEFEAYARARGVRVHVLTWQAGVGRFRAKVAGRWLARHPDGYDEPVTLSRGTPAESITPTVPLSRPVLLLEWTEESLVKR